MGNSWTLFLHSTLKRFYAPYSYILASSETHDPKYKDWVTVSAGSGYIFFSFQASTALTAQSTPTPHKNTHTHYHLFFQMWSSTRVVNSCQRGPIVFSLPISRQPSEPVLTAPLLIFIFPQNFNHFVLHLSLLACPWPRAVVLFYNVTLRCLLFIRHMRPSLSVFLWALTCCVHLAYRTRHGRV